MSIAPAIRTLVSAAFLSIAALGSSLRAETHEVPAEFPTIQAAIDASVNGDVVLVSPGTYNERILFGGREIEVRSTDGPDVTILDGGDVGPVVRMIDGEGPGTLLEGFTLRNGRGRLRGDKRFGGGVLAIECSATLRNNRITGNYGQGGAGAAFAGGAPVLENNEIVDNDGGGTQQILNVLGAGLAFFDCAPRIVGNLIENNNIFGETLCGCAGGFGCGIYGRRLADPVIEGNRILQNSANNAIGTRGGGGIYLTECTGTTVIRGNEIRQNSNCGAGGGICVVDQDTLIEDNVVADNAGDCSDSAPGGGISVEGGTCRILSTVVDRNSAYLGGGISVLDGADVTIVGCTVQDNFACFGAGLWGVDDTIITNCTIVSNDLCDAFGSEDGRAFTGDAIVANSIVRGNPDLLIDGNPTITFSNVEGGAAGEGNIDEEVLLSEAFDGALQIRIGSPGAIDLGNDSATGLSLVTTDPDGDDRSIDGDGDGTPRIDLGADEFRADRAVLFGNQVRFSTTADALSLNQSNGDRSRTVRVAGGDSIELTISNVGEFEPRFAVHGNLGAPTDSSLTQLPAQIGTMGFPLVLPEATPVIIWNNLGRRAQLGSSEYFGTPIPDPDPPSFFPLTLLKLPTGDTTNLPPGTTLTIQGVIEYRASISPKEISVTNGIILVIE